ncbi:MAG: penicillin-binding protein 1C [Treponema sp.]|jgi:penicillin-binding protein 1C|nr:penicillin-binding protein 1C [Treponema sp.]
MMSRLGRYCRALGKASATAAETAKRHKKRLVFGALAAILLLAFAFSLPSPLFDVPYSPVLYDREGNLLGAQVASDGQWRFPGTEKINEKFALALIETEDRRFRKHPGVDPLAVARAAYQNIRGKKIISGGSTITMQTIRLARKARKRTFFEKFLEAFLAVRLETGRSKNKILALYAANAPFGANVVGLEAAAWRWFGRSSADLSWAEAAVLAVLPNSPSLIHPGRNREILKNKRDLLLNKLFKKGYFDDETLALSVAEPLPGEPLPLPRIAPHLLDRFVLSAAKTSSLKKSSAFVTTIDKNIQLRVTDILNRASDRFALNGIFNGACVIVNTQTGEIAAYVGNTDTPHAPDVDIVSSRRSSGSLLKPFLYAAMLDSGDILPSSLVSDIPTRIGSFSPENMSRNYLGVVPADEALARSLNVPAARSLRVFGVDRFARFLRSLGLTTLFRPGDEYGLPLVLGGAEVTLFEITKLYAALGKTAGSYPANASLISSGAAWLTLEALVNAARPGEEAIWREYAGARHIAWKTGTSYGFRDAWAIGVTPEWTVGVWIGNASGEGRPELRSAVTSAPVLFEIFSTLDSLGGNRRVWFNKPVVELREVETCAYSGFPASIHCAGIKFTDIPKNAPAAKPCRFCQTVILNDTLTHRIVLEPGVFTSAVERKWFVLPPAEEWYFRRWNLDYKPLPPYLNSKDLSNRGEGVLALFNPEPDSQVYVPRELDNSEGKIVFSAAHRNETEIIYWHLDDIFLGFTQTFHEMEARPQPGPRTLTLVDSSGNMIVRRFVVLDSK